MPAQNTVVHTQANEAPDERAYDALAVHDGYTVGDSLEAVEVYADGRTKDGKMKLATLKRDWTPVAGQEG
jgi:hypothetical protein